MQQKRLRILPDKIFYKLWNTAIKGYTKREFANMYLLTINNDYINFEKKYSIHFEEAKEMLDLIYDAANLSFKDMIDRSGKRKSEIRDIFCIPIRTIEDWYSGKSKPSQYVKLMMLRYFHLINLGKYIKLQSEVEHEQTKPLVYQKHEKAEIKDESETTYNRKEKKYTEMDDDEFDKFLNHVSDKVKYKNTQEVLNSSAQSILNKTSYLDKYLKH